MREDLAAEALAVGVQSGGEVHPSGIGHDLHQDPVVSGSLDGLTVGGVQGAEASGDDGGHGLGAGVEGLVETAQEGAEDDNELGGGKEGAVAVDVFGEMLGASIAPAVEEDGCWV